MHVRVVPSPVWVAAHCAHMYAGEGEDGLTERPGAYGHRVVHWLGKLFIGTAGTEQANTSRLRGPAPCCRLRLAAHEPCKCIIHLTGTQSPLESKEKNSQHCSHRVPSAEQTLHAPIASSCSWSDQMPSRFATHGRGAPSTAPALVQGKGKDAEADTCSRQVHVIPASPQRRRLQLRRRRQSLHSCYLDARRPYSYACIPTAHRSTAPVPQATQAQRVAAARSASCVLAACPLVIFGLAVTTEGRCTHVQVVGAAGAVGLGTWACMATQGRHASAV